MTDALKAALPPAEAPAAVPSAEPEPEPDARYAELVSELRALERRVAELERLPRAAPRARGATAAPAQRAPGSASREVGAAPGLAAALGSVSLVGRSLLALAGAFVLRALSDAGTIPVGLGAVLGLVYCGAWIVVADRAARSGRGASAAFHGAVAVAIGFPLVVEAVARFGLLSAAAGAALLAGLTAAVLAVAARRRLEPLAWIATIGGVAAAAALGFAGGTATPPALYLVLLGAVTLWASYVLDWRGLRVLPAIAADLAVLVLALRAGGGRGPEGALGAAAVQVALLVAYLGSVAGRTLGLGREVLVFEIVQTAAAVAVGLGGAVYVASSAGLDLAWVGATTAAAGAGAYAVAFAFAGRTQPPRNFHFYAAVAAVLVLAGTALLVPGAALGGAWAALGVSFAVLARRLGRRTLATHAAVYGLAAALVGGLVSYAARAVAAPPTAEWAPPGPVAIVALAALAAIAWLAAGPGVRRAPERIPWLAVTATAAWGAAGLAIGLAVPLLAGVPGHGAGPGAVAAVRTALLAACALGLASLGRSRAFADAGLLAYPLLGVTGLKVLAEDLPRGRPATLIVAFACYGAALLLVPRLRRARAAAAA
jgi:hypothetical protein